MYSCTFSCSSGGCCLLVEGQAKINFSCPHKLLAAWMRILLTFVISSVSWVLATNMPESSYCFWKCNRNSGHICLYNGWPKFGLDICKLICTHCSELMETVGSHGRLSLLLMKRWWPDTFVSDTHNVMTALSVMLPSKCCFGVFSAIS